MKKLILILIILMVITPGYLFAKQGVRIVASQEETFAASQLEHFLTLGGVEVGRSGRCIYVGDSPALRRHYAALVDSLRDDGFLIAGDGRELCLYGASAKGTLYAVYAFLEMLGYRLYTPDDMVVPDLSGHFPSSVFRSRRVSNPAFRYREVTYYYPAHSQLYADWHRLHTSRDRFREWGMFVHTFRLLLPPSEYYDRHPEWFSLNNGRRSRDGQLCLSNPEVLERLCERLADTMSRRPEARIWSVSPNDNYNACECEACRHLDSLYGGRSGTLLWFVNQVARRFPDKTIATLAYQYTRQAPQPGGVPARKAAPGNLPLYPKPDSNVLVMLCPIEVGRELPIASSPQEASFRNDMEDWSRLTGVSSRAGHVTRGSQLFIWDYVVQFRNFWNPFPNLQVLQSNLQFFRRNSATMMFEQASGDNNITSWMDIRCYMLAKLLWNPDADMRSVMEDFYEGYYGPAAPYVREIIDTMTRAVVWGDQRLDIYGYPIDGLKTYLSPDRRELYWQLLHDGYQSPIDSAQNEHLLFFEASLVFAELELAAYDDTAGKEQMLSRLGWLTDLMHRFHVPIMMEMGISPDAYDATMRHYIAKRSSPVRPCTLRKPATAPYNVGGLTDGKAGIMDYRHNWLGFWGDTVDAVVDLGRPQIVEEVAFDFYYLPLSWIFMPERIQCFVSADGEEWRQIGELTPDNPEALARPEIRTFRMPVASDTGDFRYVRLVATPLGQIPSWHRAAGQKPWIFIDEILVR